MNNPKILFSMPAVHHVEIAADELDGLQKLGYPCAYFRYAARGGYSSAPGRLWVILQNAFGLIRIARKFRPDVIYFNSRLELLAGVRDVMTIWLFKIFIKYPVKFIIKSHGSDIAILDDKRFLLRRIILPYLKKNISAWLFLSTEEKDTVVQTGYFTESKIFTTKNIVRTDQFKPDKLFKSKLNIPDDHTVLLFVGRIIKAKGVFEVLEAFSLIKDSFKASLVIVGWGEELENLKQLCITMGLTDKVIFTGFIPEKDVVAFYANSDVLVFPTFFPEGFPMALFNSVAAGMAIVTTATRAAKDFLSDPENCLWVEPQSVESVKKAIVELLQSRVLMARMRMNNKNKAHLFSKEQVCQELSETIQTIIAQ